VSLLDATADLHATPDQIPCSNVALQWQFKRHSMIGMSTVAGWGLFLAEPAKRNDLIGEYMGEVGRRTSAGSRPGPHANAGGNREGYAKALLGVQLISQEEADRRGKVYDKQCVSFLFNLNQGARARLRHGALDRGAGRLTARPAAGRRVGSRKTSSSMRTARATRSATPTTPWRPTATHAVRATQTAQGGGARPLTATHPDEKKIGSGGAVTMVNGDYRIGIYAKRDIEPGEELFFQYGSAERLPRRRERPWTLG